MKEYCIKLVLVKAHSWRERGISQSNEIEIVGPAVIDFDAPYQERAVDVFNAIDKKASPAIKEALKKFKEENEEVT